MDDPWSELESMADLALQAGAAAAAASFTQVQSTDSEDYGRDYYDNYYGLLLGEQQANSKPQSVIHRESASRYLSKSGSSLPAVILTTFTTTRTKIKTPMSTKKTYYLIKLDGPLSDPETVRVVGGLSVLPETFTGSSNLDDEDEDTDSDDEKDMSQIQQQRETLFCRVDNTTKDNILSWLACQLHTTNSTPAGWRPTMIKDSAASKDLSSITPYPTLGIDTTLPQNRLTTDEDTNPLRPAQNEYPVWYFFYGTLADPDILRRLFNLPDEDPITYCPAMLRGDVHLVTWGNGKYNALVDFITSTGTGDSERRGNTVVEGKGYIVMNREQEDVLRYYETDQYEVVRCRIEVEMDTGEVRIVRGLTFRFTGVVD